MQAQNDFLLKHRILHKSILFLVNISLISLAFILSYLLRFDGNIPDEYRSGLLLLLFPLLVIKILIFRQMRLFSGLWKYVSLPDLINIIKANFVATTIFGLFVVLTRATMFLPRSVIVLDFILCLLLVSGVRVVVRITRESFSSNSQEGAASQRVLIVGAGAVGQSIVREIRQNPKLHRKITGYIDDDPTRQNQRFQGVPVLGKTEDLERICRNIRIDQVVIAQPAVCPRELREIVETCRKIQVQSKILPAMAEIIDGMVSVQHLRDVELEDLLGRDAVHLDVREIASYLNDKRVLVTGAGGSIGSEICRQVAGFSPQSIILLDNAETPLFNIENELVELYPGGKFQPFLNDIRKRDEIEGIFRRFRPEVVFHAAAYKHVPMSEKNPLETIRNNVLGTRVLADAAKAFEVRNFVMVSTDKAVNPSNVMGASKRAAEIYVQALASDNQTSFVTVRFGNVLGSNGSVVPIFKDQIKKGGPVTVTHPEVTRFFMTIPEAVQLVLQAGSMGRGGEIFLLDMGEPIKIMQLAEELIRLSGLKPYEDIDIIFSGLRPGEKLHEELLLAEEGIMATTHQKIRVARSTPHEENSIFRQIDRLEHAILKMDSPGTLRILKEIVPEYQAATETFIPSPVYNPSVDLLIRSGAAALGGRK